MRESLTIFAIALILVLSALLVGPYLVDWNGQRDWLAAKLSHAVGAEVRIAGPIDVKLLPRPIFRAAQVSITGAERQAPRFSAERLDAELSLNGLLQGTIEFVDARLTEPRLEITMRHDGSVVAPAVRADKAERIQFSHVDIERGSLVMLDEAGRQSAALTGIDADGQADTLFGPLKLSGSAETAQGVVTFRMNTGAYQSGRLRIHAAIDHKGGWSHADADGLLTFGTSGARQALAFEGSLGLSGEIGIAAAAAPVPWSLTSTGDTADVQSLAAPAVELRAGLDNHALVASGSALFSLVGKPAGIARLRARQLDLDHITVPPEVAPDTPRPSAAQWLTAVRDALDGSTALPFGLKLDVAIDAITSGDLTLTDATASVDARPGALPRVALAVAGPNASHAALDGTVELGAVPAFKGTADVTTRDLAAVAGWVAPFTPGLPAGLDEALRGEAGAFKGDVDLSAVGMVARNAALSWAGTGLDGTLSVTAGRATERPRLFADLKADTLDPAQWPGLHQVLALADPLDFDLTLRSDAVTLARSEAGVAQTGRMTLHAEKKGSEIAVDRLSVSGFDDAGLEATASLSAGRTLEAEGQANLRDVARVAEALKPVLPGLPADMLATRGPGLSPLSFSFKASADVGTDGTVTPTRLSATGAAAATRFSLAFAPGARGGDANRADAALVIDAPEAAQALQQFGWTGAGTLGALHVDARGQGSLADGFDSKVTATLPRSTLSFAGRIAQSAGQGRLTFESADLGPLLQSAASGDAAAGRAASLAADLAWDGAAGGLHNITGRVAGSTVSGDLDRPSSGASDQVGAVLPTGRLSLDTASLGGLVAFGLGEPQPKAGAPAATWSAVPFGPAPSWPSADLTLHVGALDLWPGIVGRDTGLSLQLRPGAITVADLSTHLLGGTARGSFTLRRTGAGASAAGQAGFDKLSIALPSVSGRLSGMLDLAGSGQTPAALVGSLAGDGTLALAGATVPRLASDALLRVAAQFNGEGAEVEEGPLTDALNKALDRTPAALGDLSVPATVAAGVIRVANAKTTLPDATVTTDAALDLADLTLDLRSALVATTAPPEWKGDPPQVTATWKGPLLAPVRAIDDAAFANGLAARAIAREQERIELMKDDLRERAFFARRLKQIEAEQQAAHDAALSPKPVPQPPQRPTDIHLPKPPDVGPPTLPMSIKPPAAQQDGITQLLNALPDASKAPSRLGPAAAGGILPPTRAPSKPPSPVPTPGLY